MPIEEARCPHCGIPVGERNHRPAQGVLRIDGMEMAMGNLDLGRRT